MTRQEFIRELRALLFAASWEPIESAPKDGTNILGGIEGLPRSQGEMFWDRDAWRTWDGENHTRTVTWPTHWQPMLHHPLAVSRP